MGSESVCVDESRDVEGREGELSRENFVSSEPERLTSYIALSDVRDSNSARRRSEQETSEFGFGGRRVLGSSFRVASRTRNEENRPVRVGRIVSVDTLS